MTLKKGDFVEIEFTGKIKDTEEIFDTTNEKVAKEAELQSKNVKPFTFAVDSGMLPSGFDKDVVGKEVGKEYTVTLQPENAFGKREKSLVKMIPTKLFLQQKINPQRGMQLNLDGQIVRILSNSGGRTLVDFNNPLAGKEIVYEYKLTKEIKETKEKVDALQQFLFRKTFKSEIKDKTVTLEVDKQFEPLIKMFADKFKEILGLEITAKVKK